MSKSVQGAQVDFDAIIIGAGFGGLYMLHKLRDELGLKVKAFDKAGGIGGTWYWNRYPGALSDTESFVYCYSFDEALLQDWKWDTRYVTQPQILAYLEHVADRFDLRGDIQLNTGIISAHFDETENVWTLRTDTGETFTARFLVTALGLLSAVNIPAIKGLELFTGKQIHTGAWPEDVSLTGKRVGVIGTGSTGIQVITAIAPIVDHLTVFQRSPQYSVPVGNGPVSPDQVESVKARYPEIWSQVRKSVVAFGFDESTVSAMSVSVEEQAKVFQQAWEIGGGFRFMFETFNDITTDPAANEVAASFVRAKIAEIVRDPETARLLTPTELYAKRPLCDSGYYATFNRGNVSLVDTRSNPVIEATCNGLRTADGSDRPLDVLIFATGFDAVDGSYTRIDIRGRGGMTMSEHWRDGSTSYLGMLTSGFPNLFMILGPNGPFTNLPPSIEAQVEWIADLIGRAAQNDLTTIEATPDAEAKWAVVCNDIAEMTLFPKLESWIFGANIPGKKRGVMFYFAGLGAYRKEISSVAQDNYRGLKLQ